MRYRLIGTALALDIASVLVFCAVGRRNHAEGVTMSGVAQTAWPFLAGALVGWLIGSVLGAGWRNPTALAPTGVIVWGCTVVVGMLLRRADSQGTAISFVIVAATVTAVLLLGWRGVASAIGLRRRRHDHPGAQSA